MRYRNRHSDSVVYTIGHSNHPIEHFLDLLDVHHIDTVVDVRSQPYSRHNPQYCRNAIRDSLAGRGIHYRFLGNALGGKTTDPLLMDDEGRPDWIKMAQTDAFRIGISELDGLMALSRVAIVCAEEDPSKCHRRHLITPALYEMGGRVFHIRGDGRVETETELRETETGGQRLLF